MNNEIEILFDNSKKQNYSNESLLRGIARHTFLNTVSTPENLKSNGGTGDYVKDIDPGVFTKNPKGWNIQAACKWLHAHAASNSQHACAKYVRMAIEAGGISTNGRPRWAWKYIDYLPKIGFKFEGKIKRNDSFNPEPGDIVVYQKNGNPSEPGHICMWTGAEWASDFRQSGPFVYRATNEGYLFRFVS